MDLEKHSFKGGFLQLFDWKVKSRKKLFSSKSELSDMSMSMSMSTQGNQNVNGSTFSRFHQVRENGYSSGSGIRDRYILSNEFPSSNEESYGTKAPGVVARLMGLDSLPISNNVESCFTPFWGSPSFRRDSVYTGGILGCEDEECIVNGDRMTKQLDGFGRNSMELMVNSQPIKRFQTEVLPPKLAKPISITHHRLLSPVKTPGFVPTMNSASLMEAAGKLIEQSPRKRVSQKLPSFGSSSVPFQIQNRLEAVEKPRRILDRSQMGKQRNFNKNGHVRSSVVSRVDSPDLLRANKTIKTASCEDLKRKTKTKGDQGSTNLWLKRDEAKTKHGFVSKTQEENPEKVLKRTPAIKKSDALKQNNQKQNRLSTKEKVSLGPSLPNEKEKKSSSVALSRPNKRNLLSTDSLSINENSLVKTPSSSTSRKKKEGKRNTISGRDSVASLSQGYKSTSPIKKAVHEANISGKRMESERNLFPIPDSHNSQSSCDALSMLLEEKIKELTFQADVSTDSVQTFGSINLQNSKWNFIGDKTDNCSTFDVCSSSSTLSEIQLETMQKRQEFNRIKKIGMDKYNEQDPRFGYSQPISSPEPSYSEGSCKSFDNSKSVGSQGWSTNETYQEEVDAELDSASSASVKTMCVTSRFTSSILNDSWIWEFRYIKSVLFSTDLMLEEFALGQVQKIIPPKIFNQLENEKSMQNQDPKRDLKLSQRTLFDCVEESLEKRCSLLINGGRKHWMKVLILFREKDWLVEDLYREIAGLTSNGEEVMVDELVEKDMSSQLGSWVDFEIEAFEEVVDIGDDILTSLVDEFITVLLL